MNLAAVPSMILICSLSLMQTSAFGQASSGGLATSLPKLTKSNLLLTQKKVAESQLVHPDPSGLSASTGVCLEKNINGNLLPKITSLRACAAFPTATVWLEGNKVASFAKPDASKVAKGRLKTPKKTTF